MYKSLPLLCALLWILVSTGYSQENVVLGDFDTVDPTVLLTGSLGGSGKLDKTDNPSKSGINTSDKVGKITSNDKNQYEYFRIASPADTYTSFSMKVFSSATFKIGIKFVANGVDTWKYVDYSTANEWQELSFDLSAYSGQGYTFFSILPDIWGSQVFDAYFDDMFVVKPTSTQLETLLGDYDQLVPMYTEANSLGGSGKVDVTDNPSSVAPNTSAKVGMVMTNTKNQYEFFRLKTPDDLAEKFSFLVYAEKTFLLAIKVNETVFYKNYTEAGKWQQIETDLTALKGSSYTNILVMPDAGGTTEFNIYFDDFKLTRQVQVVPGSYSEVVYAQTTLADYDKSKLENVTSWQIGGSKTVVTAPNPVKSGINTSDSCGFFTLSVQNMQCVTFTPATSDFDILSMKVLGQKQLSNINLKIEGLGNVIDGKYQTSKSGWQEITWDLSAYKGKYTKLSVFPNLYIVGTEEIGLYFDDVAICKKKKIFVPGDDDVTIANIFGEGMVVQQKAKVKVWGTVKNGFSVVVKTSWGDSVTAVVDGEKWVAELNTPQASQSSYTMTLYKSKSGSAASKLLTYENVLVGEVWLASGQSNMSMTMTDAGYTDLIASLNEKNIRIFTVDQISSASPLSICSGSWKAVEPANTGSFSAAACFFAKALSDSLKVPVGIINASYGSSSCQAWASSTVFESNAELSDYFVDKAKSTLEYHYPALLFNGMLNPVIPYALGGFIWYQGEANYNSLGYYARLQKAMVDDWRVKWGIQDAPFYFVQVAPYLLNGAGQGGPSPYMSAYALFRDEQAQTLDLLDHSGMVVTLDAGDPTSIHPKNKKVVGDRLATYALAEKYGLNMGQYKSPQYESVAFDGNQAVVTFKAKTLGNELMMKKDDRYTSETLTDFWIAGSDKIFHKGSATIEGNTVRVSSTRVSAPVAVRFAYYDCAEPNLFDGNGLPVASFRTDNWNEKDVRFREFKLYGTVSDYDSLTVWPSNIWGNLGYSLVANPKKDGLNQSEQVVKVSNGAFGYEGFSFKTYAKIDPEFAQFLAFNVYADDAAALSTFTIKLEDSQGIIASQQFDLSSVYTEAGKWQTVRVDLPVFGLPCYDVITLIPNIWTAKESSFYLDNIVLWNDQHDNPTQSGQFKKADNKLSVYPNPVNDRLFFSGVNIDGQSWSLSDLSGKIIQKGLAESNNAIDVSTLKPAVYIFRLGNHTQKLIRK